MSNIIQTYKPANIFASRFDVADVMSSYKRERSNRPQKNKGVEPMVGHLLNRRRTARRETGSLGLHFSNQYVSFWQILAVAHETTINARRRYVRHGNSPKWAAPAFLRRWMAHDSLPCKGTRGLSSGRSRPGVRKICTKRCFRFKVYENFVPTGVRKFCTLL